MDKIYLIIILLLFFVSCNSVSKNFLTVKGVIPNGQMEPCSSFFMYINKNWKRHKKLNCYYNNKKLIEKFEHNKNCFSGLRMEEIKALLGEPNLEEADLFSYMLSEKCASTILHDNDYVVYFFINKNKKIEGVEIKKIHKDY